MRKFQLVFTVFVGLLFATSCGNTARTSGKQSSKHNQTATVNADTASSSATQIDTSTEKLVYHPSRTVLTDLLNTKLELTPIWEKSQMKGVETLTAKPHFYPSDSLILDAKGMDIYSVKLGNKLLNYTYQDDILKIKLDRTYSRDESYTVVIDYLSKPEDRIAGGSAAITSDKGLYFINPKNEKDGYMPQIWTQGESESNSVWFPTVDSPNMKSPGEIYLTVDKKYKTLSNGKLMSSTVNKDGTRTDYWKQTKPISMYLYMIAVGEFNITKDSYTKSDGSKLDVDYYVEPEWAYQAKNIYGNTPEMIGFFSKLLGVEYPWSKFSQIVVREYVSGAMENVGAVVFGDFMYRDSVKLDDERLSSDAVIAHELFHHWFGDLVTTESWSNLTLNESFANYSEYLWNEHKYGKDVAQLNLEKSIDGYYNSFNKHDLVWFTYKDKEDMFDATTYNKGGAILHQLRGYLGDEAFFKALHLYLSQNAYTATEVPTLRMAFEKVCGEDLNWYFNEWYYGKGEPEVNINLTYNYGKTQFTLDFNQVQNKDFPTFIIPIEIAYTDNAGTHTQKFKITNRKQQFSFAINGTLKTIIIDPNKTLLGHYNFLHKNPAFWLEQFKEAKNYAAKKEAIINYFELVNSRDKINEFSTLALKDDFYGTQDAVLGELQNKIGTGDSVDLGQYVDVDIIKNLILNSTKSDVRSTALDLYLSSNTVKADKITFLDNLSEKEKSYKVLAAILGGYMQLEPDKADQWIEKFNAKYKSTDIEFEIANHYLKNRIPGKMDFFKDLYKNAGLRDKGNAIMYMGYYSFMSGFEAMNEYVSTVDSVYNDLGRYKGEISNLFVMVYEQLSNGAEQLKEGKNDPKNMQNNSEMLDMVLKTKHTFADFLKKHEIKFDEVPD